MCLSVHKAGGYRWSHVLSGVCVSVSSTRSHLGLGVSVGSPGGVPLWTEDHGIRSASGRYASYWNAFLSLRVVFCRLSVDADSRFCLDTELVVFFMLVPSSFELLERSFFSSLQLCWHLHKISIFTKESSPGTHRLR